MTARKAKGRRVRRPPFLLPRSRAQRAGHATAGRAWGLLAQPLRDVILDARIKGRCGAQEDRACAGTAEGAGPLPARSWGFFSPDMRLVYFAPELDVPTALHLLAHATDFACGPPGSYATDAPAFARHVADLSALAPGEYFADAFTRWHLPGGLRGLDDPSLHMILTTLSEHGRWPPGLLTWPDLTTRRRIY